MSDATEPTPNEAAFFEPLTRDEMESLVSDLGAVPQVKEGADTVPPSILKSLESAPPELLQGYLLGSLHTSKAIAAMLQAANTGDARSAGLIRLRMDTTTYLVCRLLTTGGSRIILPT